MPVSLPFPEAVSGLFNQLLPKKTTAKAGTPWAPSPTAPSYVATYRNDAGALVGLSVFDIQLAATTAAALVLVGPGLVNESVKARKLVENLGDNLNEVANICTRFFQVEGAPRVKLDKIHPCPPNLPADVSALLTKPNTKLYMEVAVDGYGKGNLALFA